MHYLLSNVATAFLEFGLLLWGIATAKNDTKPENKPRIHPAEFPLVYYVYNNVFWAIVKK